MSFKTTEMLKAKPSISVSLTKKNVAYLENFPMSHFIAESWYSVITPVDKQLLVGNQFYQFIISASMIPENGIILRRILLK